MQAYLAIIFFQFSLTDVDTEFSLFVKYVDRYKNKKQTMNKYL